MLTQTKLLKCLQLSSKYMMRKDILELSFLNKFFSTHFLIGETRKSFLLKTLSDLLMVEVNSENFQEMLDLYTGIYLGDLNMLMVICKDSKNLIQNPFGQLGFNCWERIDGANNWSIEPNMTYKDCSSCFIASFEWGKLSVWIDISDIGENTKLYVGSPVRSRSDSGGTASVELEVFNRYEEVKKASSTIILEKSDNKWELISVCIDLDEYDTLVNINFSGKDDTYWDGNYGPRFGFCFARKLTEI